MEMSRLNKNLPKIYKGYDIDSILEKVLAFEPITEEEQSAVTEARIIYYKKMFEEREKRFAELSAGQPIQRCK